MAWMIGIDEAGYGPNLGPLVAAATAWKVEERSKVGGQQSGTQSKNSPRTQATLAPTATSVAPRVDLYARLSHIVAPAPADNRIAIADSKTLYKPGSGLRHLERGLLPNIKSRNWQELFDAADPAGERHALPWYADYNGALPIDASNDELTDLAETFNKECLAAEVQLLDIRARAVFPRELNDLTAHHGTKGAALSHISIALLKEVLHNLQTSDLQPPTSNLFQITCDKHGGRNRYAALLQHHFPDDWIDTIEEGRARQPLCLGTTRTPLRSLFSYQGRGRTPHGARLHGRQVPSRTCHACLQQILDRKSARLATHRRLSRRRQTIQSGDREEAKKTRHRRARPMEKPLK